MANSRNLTKLLVLVLLPVAVGILIAILRAPELPPTQGGLRQGTAGLPDTPPKATVDRPKKGTEMDLVESIDSRAPIDYNMYLPYDSLSFEVVQKMFANSEPMQALTESQQESLPRALFDYFQWMLSEDLDAYNRHRERNAREPNSYVYRTEAQAKRSYRVAFPTRFERMGLARVPLVTQVGDPLGLVSNNFRHIKPDDETRTSFELTVPDQEFEDTLFAVVRTVSQTEDSKILEQVTLFAFRETTQSFVLVLNEGQVIHRPEVYLPFEVRRAPEPL